MKKYSLLALLSLFPIILFFSTNAFGIPTNMEDPERIPIDTPISVTLSGVFETKNFYIVTKKDGYLICDVSQTNPNGTYGAHFVLNWEGGCCGEMISANISGTDVNRFIGNSAGAGRYNITLENGSGGENTITFKITLDSTKRKNDIEPNETYENANLIELNSKKTGHINFVDPSNRNLDVIDIYKIRVTSPGKLKLNLDLTSSIFQTEINLAWIALLDSNLNFIAEDSALQKAMLSLDDLNKGLYYVRVIARLRQGNPYIYGNEYVLSNSFSPRTTTLPSYLPKDGLVTWYPFNGNANDETGNGNDGTVYGATLIQDHLGNPSSAYHFDGAAYIKGSSSNFPTQNRTVSIWYKIDDWANYNTLMGYGGGVCGTSFFAVLNPTGSKLFTTDSHCAKNSVATSNGYSENNNWNNWIITSNGVKTIFYLNGKKIYDTIVNYYGTDVAGKDFAFGSMSSASGHAPYSDENVSLLKGSLDDIVIYDRVLNSTEIQQLYCSCIQPSITIASKSILEGDTGTKQLKFPVTLSNAFSKQVKVKYKTIDNTAKADNDYIKITDSLIFKPGQTSKNISITIKGDLKIEPNETFYVKLYEPYNATIANDTAIGKIHDDDSKAIVNGLAENDNAKSMSPSVNFLAYPNPVKNALHIQTKGDAIFSLCNGKGEFILRKEIQNIGIIDCSILSNGIYFLKNETTGEVQKILITK